MTVSIIGKNSYLARHFLATKANPNIVAVSHDAVGDITLSKTECVVNFGYPRAYMTEPYDPRNDFDRTLIDRIKESDAHFIMFSSRKVYDRSCPCPWDESSSLVGQGQYGRNKIITEDYLRNNLPNRHTILRLGNIIENEPGRHTFFGIALRSLNEEGQIKLNVAPSTERDFIPLKNFAAALATLIHERPLGTFNLSSGRGTAIVDVAARILEGF